MAGLNAIELIADNIDRLITMEIRPRNWMSGYMTDCYPLARKRAGGSMTLAAARLLKERVGKGDTVLLASGAGVAPTMTEGETDGPAGAAGLARALSLGLGAVPVLIQEQRFMRPTVASARAVGLVPQEYEVAKGLRYTCAVEALPTNISAKEQVDRVFKRYNPKAIISIEKTGHNNAGVYSSIRGILWPSSEFAAVDEMFAEAKKRGVATIGIGDGGNEVGTGPFRDITRKAFPRDFKTNELTGQDIANVSDPDVAVLAGTSNWGAYGVEAALALLLGNSKLVHDGETERRVLEACSAAGGVDGLTGMLVAATDGVPLFYQVYLQEVLRLMVDNGTTDSVRDF